jgi:hypothetical protein
MPAPASPAKPSRRDRRLLGAQLEPGTYDVVVTMAGFGNATRTGMVLSPDRQCRSI